MIWTVDRIEGDSAVVEILPDRTCNIPVSALPDGVAEGDVLSVRVNRLMTRRRRRDASRRLRRLTARKP